ncbi:MAG: Aminopeptidase N [Gemmatimonadaceae bacterium]|nr:Aminopeptidase N [Gemmatimonadaceae bacterium]
MMRHRAIAIFLISCVTPALAAQPGPATDSLMGIGVSLKLAEYRAARIANTRYELALDITDGDTAMGRVTLRFQARRPGDVIVDFRGPAILRSRVNGKAIPVLDWNGAHVRIPASHVRQGPNRLEFEFKALIAAAGASIIRVRDPVDSATYLYTLLVPSDANQLFPCFDQPNLKARVSLTLTTPMAWTAVANGDLVRADSSSRGRVHVFRESEPISTYLIAFAAGPWATFSSQGTGRKITLYARRSRANEVDVDSIIRSNDQAVTWLQRYFQSPFPFRKLDVVLAPAFPFGGMEHPGAIFYSEERFVFRERPTRSQRYGRTATIYHEVAHQWFGDFVTMRWFDDLWLKEGFATYMAAKMQASMDSSSEAWKTFYLRNKPAAYAVDVSEGTTPVWQRLTNLDQAKSNYGAIVYNKAPGILKQLNYVVGERAFRSGLQLFLRRFPYGNATWRDLLDAIGDAAGRSLRTWGDDYILRPGVPIVEQRSVTSGGRLTKLVLSQRPARAISGQRPWPIRLEVVTGHDGSVQARLPVTMDADSLVVDLPDGPRPPDFAFANGDDQAYALVLPDSATVSVIERAMRAVADPLLRAQLWGALWDLVRQARLAPERYVSLAVRELQLESDDQIVSSIVARLSRATLAYLDPTTRDTLLPEVERVLLAGSRKETNSYDVRKTQLDAFVRIASTPAAVGTLDAMLDSATAAGAPLLAPTRWAIVTRLVALQAPSAERRLAEETNRDRTPEGARRAFVAGAARASVQVKSDYFRRYFADSALNEDWATASIEAFNDLGQQPLTRPFLRAALDSLAWIQRNRRIFFLGSWLNGFMEGQTSQEGLTTIRDFLHQRRDLAADLRAKVLQSLDELERTVRINQKYSRTGVSDDP